MQGDAKREHDAWWERPALCIANSDEDSPYFPMQLWSSSDTENSGDCRSCFMSYGDFINTCAHICNRLLELHEDLQRIVVAVPEGPLIPLAVASVHTLNFTEHHSILIPIDPRHASVLEASFSTHSLLILVSGDCDRQRMERICSSKLHSVIDLQNLLPERVIRPSCMDSFVHPSIASLAHTIALSGNLPLSSKSNCVSHIVFTSGTSGRPKGCVCSRKSLLQYLSAKNQAHNIAEDSTVFLASSISFDPCFSDCLSTLSAAATLALPPYNPCMKPTHILCTPTQWKNYDWGPTPSLKLVALGGEKIPDSLRNQCNLNYELHATYGVTEACVYQTMGSTYGSVGKPFPGMNVAIWEEATNEPVGEDKKVGEVVLSGNQLDGFSGYFEQTELTLQRFFRINDTTYYRTGDLGYMENGYLFIVGRIAGDDMVKYNGVRVNLGEVEEALRSLGGVVSDVIVACPRKSETSHETTSVSDILAYVVLTTTCWSELRRQHEQSIPETGLLCTCTPLLALLRKNCQFKTRIVPSAFILLDHIPTTVTGKRNRLGVPALELAQPWLNDMPAVPLAAYGRSGKFVAQEIQERLNLFPAQASMMTNFASYAILGGDSLTATLIVRSLYARHCKVRNSRHLGGGFGNLEGPFAVKIFLCCRTLGDYVDLLDSSEAFTDHCDETKKKVPTSILVTEESRLFSALLEATSLRFSSIAVALLEYADPNHGEQKTGFRMAKTTRIDRKVHFRSSPLHLACLHGDPCLVQTLLDHGAKINIPNPSGLYPIHLAASGEYQVNEMPEQEQEDRLQCIRCLLDAGAPVTMGDGNKQSVLHAAARAGNNCALKYLVQSWEKHSRKTGFEWRDVWSRTPVHWAVMNGRCEALGILLEAGSCPNPKTISERKVHTSLVLETPLEVCRRVYGDSALGQRLEKMLLEATENI